MAVYAQSKRLASRRNVLHDRHEWLLLKKQDGGKLDYADAHELKGYELKLVELGGMQLTTYEKSRI